MLTIQINKKWFDMILSGIKTEEYREIKPYYTTRFYNMFGVMWMSHLCGTAEMPRDGYKRPEKEICFQNGYSKNSPSFCHSPRGSVG